MVDVTFREANAVAFVIQQATDLRQIALALDGVLNRCRFHEKGVRFVFHAIDAILILLHEHIAIRVHVVPHRLIGWDARILRTENRWVFGKNNGRCPYSKELFGGTGLHDTVFDLGLLGQVFGAFDGIDELLDGEKGS